MQPTEVDRDHSYYQDLLGADALGALSAEERRLLTAHLVTCEECRAELERLRGAAQALPLMLHDREPSPILRYRIQAALQRDLAAAEAPVRAERRPTPAPASVAFPPTPPPSPMAARRRVNIPWAAAAAVLLAFSLGMLLWNLQLRQSDDERPPVQTIALQPAAGVTSGGGQLTYMKDQHIVLLTMRDLPRLDPGKLYQVWLIRDKTPAPVGVFDAQTTEFAVAADLTRYQTLAITVEPGPLGSAKPTGPGVMTAPLQSA